ncbi:MAG: hypothetical protein LCH37_14255 [Bacteroidetes bacterium]|nr:hypothetical protein [Bacteroidota bacterium]
MLLKFQQKLLELGLSPEVLDKLIQNTCRVYGSTSRHYHNLIHITSMFEMLIPIEVKFKNPLAVYLAVIFHDWIYDSTKSDNEEKSAEVAAKFVKALPNLASLDVEISQLVMCTKNHEPTHSDSAFLIDADLAILGAPVADYLKYSKQIRLEYAWVSENEYREGRKKVITKFLQRTSLFHTGHFKELFEEQARFNLQAELKELH